MISITSGALNSGLIAMTFFIRLPTEGIRGIESFIDKNLFKVKALYIIALRDTL
jgi:hypothetical protein